MKCRYKNKFSHVDNAKGNGVRSEPHRTLQMFLGTRALVIYLQATFAISCNSH
jgi:hypothetical protein